MMSGVYSYLIGFSISFLIITMIYLSDDKKYKLFQKKVEELSRNKVWSIPVQRHCPHCKSLMEFEFDLETKEVECESCGDVSEIKLDTVMIPKN